MVSNRQHKWTGRSLCLIVPDEVLDWIEEEAKKNYQNRTEYTRMLLIRAKRQSESLDSYAEV